MTLLPTLFQMFYFLFFMSYLYKFKESKFLSIVLLLGTALLFYFCNSSGVSLLGKFVFTISLFLYTVFIFEGKLKEKLRSFLIALFVISSSEFVAVFICNAFNVEINLENIRIIFFLTILTQLLNYLIGGSIINLFCGKKYFVNKFYLSYPFILIICFLFNLDYHAFFSDKVSFISIIFIISTFVCIMTISNMAYEIRKLESSKKIEKMKMEESFLKSKYDYLDENYQKNFKYFHDLLHFFNELTILAKEKKVDKIINRIDFISKQTLDLFSEIYSNSPILSSLISEYKDIIKEKNIVIVPTIKNVKITSLSLIDETNLLRELFNYAFNLFSEDFRETKMILIKSDLIGQQRILTFSFTANKKDEESLNILISIIKKMSTARVNAEFIENLSMIEIIIIFSS